MIDIDKLEALAKAATPGPWRGDRFDGTVKYDIVAGDYPNGEYAVVCRGDNGSNFGFMKAEDEDYALAANPAAILALIAEVRALREDAERYRWIRQGKPLWVKVPVRDKHVEYFIGHKPEPKFPECFDAAIDVARGAK